MEVLSICASVFIFIYTIRFYIKAPDIVPTHFGINGQPDSWGSKNMLFIISGIATVLYLFLTIMSKKPHLFNYPVIITEENAKRQYKLAIEFLSIIKFSVIVLFLMILNKILSAIAGELPISILLPLPVLFSLFVVFAVIIYIIWARKIK